MGYEITMLTDGAAVDRDENDKMNYDHLTRPDSDSDSDSDMSDFDDDNWLIGGLAKGVRSLLHKDSPALRVAVLAQNYKAKCDSVLSDVGLFKPTLQVDEDTGNCTTCDGMNGFLSGFAHVQRAASAGCPSCNILVQAVKAYLPEKHTLSSPKLGLVDEWNSGCAGRHFIRTSKTHSAELPGAMGITVALDGTMDIRNVFTKFNQVESEVVMELNLFGVEDDPASWDRIGLANHISGDTSSDAAFQWFRRQLDRCAKEHSLCSSQAYSNGLLPTRVLDLGAPPGAFPDLEADVRLIESHGRRDRYVCLSYCWGGTIDIRLTRDRYDDYTQGIAWDMLPQGYRDAINLTRRLGIRYIWIDSLCIIQDDEDDWREQAAQMAPIYQGAYVTIAATSAASPSTGYFSVSPRPYLAKRLCYRDEKGVTHTAYARRTIPHFFSSTAFGERGYSLDRPPLLSRGWVFQERLLSPRILHLGAVEMAWECNESCACECMGETQTYASEPRWAHTKGSHVRNMAMAKDENDVQIDWRSLVVNYTQTRLTFDRDIFPAISGVVKDMQRHREDRYLAGVWESSILDDLAWHATDSSTQRPSTWLAPSWSWASTTSPVYYSNHRTVLSSKYVERTESHQKSTVLIDASVTTTNSDATVGFLAGKLILFGPLIKARLLGPTTEEEERRNFHYALHDETMLMIRPDYRLGGPEGVPIGADIYLLFLCREPKLKANKEADTKTRVFSLVLRRVDQSQGAGCGYPKSDTDADEIPRDGTYERIGIYIDTVETAESNDYVEENGLDVVVNLV